MSLYQELKRRNVFRVGVFYAVSAWLILQVADVMFGVLRLPDWTLTFVAALLALGFPLAVTFSWIYELTPEGIKKESEIERSESVTPQTGKRLDRLIIVGLVAVIAVLLVERFWSGGLDRDGGQQAVETPSAGFEGDRTPSRSVPGGRTPDDEASEGATNRSDPGASPDNLSIAVLPFANLSSDEENEYFADGLTEELLNALAQIGSLKVAGRTSSFYFKGRNEDLKAIGDQLGVANVLEGSVRKAGNRVRITAQLIKVDDGFHLWSDTFDRDLADIFAVQEEISTAIADALKVELGLRTAEAERPTDDLDAYELYLEAKARVSNRDGMEHAFELLKRAVELDPEFAEAWATLGQAYALGPYYGLVTFEESALLVEEATSRALALEPNLASALTARADMLRDSFEWEEAERLYLEALSQRPDDVEANSQYAQFLGRAGYIRDSLPYSRKARELDPLAAVHNTVYAANLVLLGEHEAAARALTKALEVKPDFDFAMLVRYRQLISLGRLEEAEPFMVDHLRVQGASDAVIEAARQALASTVAGEAIQAIEQIKATIALAEQEAVSGRWNYADTLTDLAALNGNWQLVMELKNRFSFIDWASQFAPLRDLPVWKTEARESDLVSFWRKRGWPQQCRPAGDDNFECD
ncbi:MAG: hypothetical protein R3200_10515 [Xanthomonadales bacterium]|nr:hypothetical protein [Xanthomonadales bacterium]